MESLKKDASKIFEINCSRVIRSIFFTKDGKLVSGGGDEGILRQWRVDDGQEVGEAIQVENAEIYAAALSPDQKWLVCGIRNVNGRKGSDLMVWDAQTHKQVLSISGHKSSVFSVDISSDSTKFASASLDKCVFIWSMTGEKLVGPLEHDDEVVAVRFSPAGDRIATATGESGDVEKVKAIRIYDSDNGEQLLPDIPFKSIGRFEVPLFAWSADGRQLFLVSCSEAKCFDTSSGSLLTTWTIPSGRPTSIALARNQKFAAILSHTSLSFWDTSTHKQIGTAVTISGGIRSIGLSPNDDCIATGEVSGKITLWNLRETHPGLYFSINLPLMYIGDMTFKSWSQGNLIRVEELLTQEIALGWNAFYHARALAHRALVRTRLKHWKMAIDDAKKSIEVQRSVVAHIAHTLALVGSGQRELAMRVIDLMFRDCLPSENRFLLLVKAIILFECGKHNEAVSRVEDLINLVDDKSLYITVRARMFLLLGTMSMSKGDNKHAIELFKRAQEAIPFQLSPHLVTISLIFGWDFDRLSLAIQFYLFKAMHAEGNTEVLTSLSIMVETLGEDALASEVTPDWDPELVQRCLTAFERNGDEATQSNNAKEAIVQYSIALSMNPSNPATLYVKRSKARAMLGSWEDALKDADEAVKADPKSPWGYKTKHAAFHALRRFDEAIDAFSRMFSLLEGSPDKETVSLKNYVSPPQSEMIIDNVIHGVFKICPLVLIDIKSGRLCDSSERIRIFKSESDFKELVSSMTEELDDTRTLRVVKKYFEYVTLSHVWEGKEPSFQDVNSAKSVWSLESSPLNDKLRKFCEVVREDGYRWAWSDTCCIDKTISTVLNQSLTMMYKWYEASTATFVLLADAGSLSASAALIDTLWMTRAWTAQELLAPKVIRFYNRNWKPYLDDTLTNHKESSEIMQQVVDAVGLARETITSFHPNALSVREKLRLASNRNATVEEDVAYSLIGIFKSDIRPNYGEGDSALGHLLEEIVNRSGDVTVLAWTGKCLSYNSSLPASLSVYSGKPSTFSAIEDATLDLRVEALRASLSREVAIPLYDQITRLPPARFANRRLHLPCIIFGVKRLGVQNLGNGQETHYRTRVPGVGHVEFSTSDRVSLTEPHKLLFVHPWVRDLRDTPDGFTSRGTAPDDDSGSSDSDSDPNSDSDVGSSPSSPLHPKTVAKMDEYTRALRLVVRLQQPFHALLLQQQPDGEFKRIAAEHEIIVPGVERHFKDIRSDVLEIL